MAVDHTEFIKIMDFEPQEKPDPDALMAQAQRSPIAAPATKPATACADTDDLLKSLGL
jgi:hypothetical protein